MECNHIHVVKQVNHGTWEKDVYRCENPACKRLLVGKLEADPRVKVAYPSWPITVASSFGTPEDYDLFLTYLAGA